MLCVQLRGALDLKPGAISRGHFMGTGLALVLLILKTLHVLVLY